MIDMEAQLKQWEQIRFFKPKEFDSPDEHNSGFKMNIEFIKALDNVRYKCGSPFKITSGYRTRQRNEAVGGVTSSAHTVGLACDISVMSSAERYKIVKYALEQGFKRIGIGKTFIHLDMSYPLPQEVLWLY